MARIDGITPWLKVAHLVEAVNVMVSPHFLMELHLPLVCAVPNSKWLEYIPQLDSVTGAPMAKDPKTRQWWTLTDPCQSPLTSRAVGEQWATMTEVFHTD